MNLFTGEYGSHYLLIFAVIVIFSALIDMFLSFVLKKGESKLTVFIKGLGIHFIGIVFFTGGLLFVNRILSMLPFFDHSSKYGELIGLTGMSLYVVLLFGIIMAIFLMKVKMNKMLSLIIQLFVAIGIFYICLGVLNFSIPMNNLLILADIILVVLISNWLIEYL
ncbi:hypothetical protein IR133_08500 [Staphylococcus saprophyticus]|uniref:hypothetical protein n=1 Tax=Staphylococcus xylosus TaxID=1288 RepID=UPI001073C5D3|nr:hypothetical protein [Staphylococcus xylosus]MBF0813756.1 hypothetical protein [Staphylococcus saprophyticus]TFV23703.1 hypothetical protein E4T75_08490 [Staphylococcus saprophyticus]